MQPHPVSEVNPFDSVNWLLRRTLNVMEDVPPRLSGLGIGGKLDRYVIQIFDSKSVRNVSGQPWLSLLDSAGSDNGSHGRLCRSINIGGSVEL